MTFSEKTMGMLSSNFRTLTARFDAGSTSKPYHYFIPSGDNPKVGDVVLTSQSFGGIPVIANASASSSLMLSNPVITPAPTSNRDYPASKTKSFSKSKPVNPPEESDFTDSEEEDDDDDFTTIYNMSGNERDQILHIDVNDERGNVPTGSISPGFNNSILQLRNIMNSITSVRLAIVTELHEKPSDKANRFYILSVPLQRLYESKARVSENIAEMTLRAKARQRLIEIVREESELNIFRSVAENNPEARALIDMLEGKSTKSA